MSGTVHTIQWHTQQQYDDFNSKENVFFLTFVSRGIYYLHWPYVFQLALTEKRRASVGNIPRLTLFYDFLAGGRDWMVSVLFAEICCEILRRSIQNLQVITAVW